MDNALINHLYYIFTYKLVDIENSDNNFNLYFREVLKRAHFFTKVLVIFSSILLNFLSFFFNFKLVKNLSLEKTESLINLTSKLSVTQNFFKIVKIYSYIYCFEKNL
jgi:hypothetical protein